MKWIKLKDQKPPRGERVLVWNSRGKRVIIENEFWLVEDGDYSHWMPLPEPPK